MKSEALINVLDVNEATAWDSVRAVIDTLLGKHRSNNYRIAVQDMLDSFHEMGISMSLKIHFLHQHLDIFANQISTESDEQGERFHQTVMPMERRYKGKKLDAMLGELCWWMQQIYKYNKRRNKEEIEAEDDDLINMSDASDDSDSE